MSDFKLDSAIDDQGYLLHEFNRIRHISKKPLKIIVKAERGILGFNQLPNFAQEILITFQEIDVRFLRAKGYYAVGLTEDLSKLTQEQISKLKARCSNLLLVGDSEELDKNKIGEFLYNYPFIKHIILPKKLKSKTGSNSKICKGISCYFNHYTIQQFECLIDQAITQNRIAINVENIVMTSGEKKKVIFSNLYSSLNQAGIFKYKIEGQEKYIRIRKGSIIEELSSNDIKDIVINEMKKRGLADDLEKIYQGSNYYFSQSTFSNLEQKRKLQEFNGELGVEYFFFNGKVWRINQVNIEEISYENFSSYIWDTNTIDWFPVLEKDYFAIAETDSSRLHVSFNKGYCDFLDFVFATSNVHWRLPQESLTEEQKIEIDQHVINKITGIGYLLHTFRENSERKAVIATDFIERNKQEEHGGTGKSLLGTALIEMLSTYYRGARQKDFLHDKHLLGGMNQTTRLVFFDDASKYFDFGQLYTWITGKIDINKKFQDVNVLDKDRSVKFYVTTNYAMLDPSFSKDRRYFYMCFSDYYGPHRKPTDDFDQELLCKNWSWEQKNRFYNFMAQCVKAYLKFGLIEAPKQNIRRNQLRASINESFLEWAEENCHDFIDKEISRKTLYNLFQSSLSELEKRKFSPTAFKKYMKDFCKLKGFLFNPSKEGKDIKRNSNEYFEIMSTEEV